MKKLADRKRARRRAPKGPVEDADFSTLRRQIRNRVGQDAMRMVEATIAAVNAGQYGALKYLFEAVGLFPVNVQDEAPAQSGLALALLRALGLPEVPDPDPKVQKVSDTELNHS